MTKSQKIILFLLSTLNFTHILDFMIMMPLGVFLMPYFKISPLQFSFIVSAYTISAGISGFLAAFFVDNFDRKKILLSAYILFLVGTIACGVAPTFYLLLFARVFAGVFGGLIGAQVTSIVSDTFSYETRGRAMGAVMSGFAVASTLGMPFALFLANKFSWHAPFLFVGVLGCILVPFIILFLPKMDAHITPEKQSFAEKLSILTSVLKNKNQLNALIFSFLMMGGHFLMIPFINPYMIHNVGYTKDFTPLIYLVGGIASFISANVLGKIADKHGKLKVYTWCLLSAIPMIIIITNIPFATKTYITLFVFGLWFAVSTGRGVTGTAMVSNVVDATNRGSFQSFNSSMQQLGTGLAAFVAGLIITENAQTKAVIGYEMVGYLSVFVLLCSLFLARKIFKQ
jgi:MFS transporter, DHA1 family, inner membrane transport protein